MTASQQPDVMQQLGEVIRTHREMRDINLRKAADMLGCPQSLIADWEAGKEVPDSTRWARLCHMVNRGLFRYNALRLEALKVQAARRHREALGSDQKVTVSFGDKLAAVIPIMKPIEKRPTMSDIVAMVMEDTDKEAAMPRYDEMEQPDEPTGTVDDEIKEREMVKEEKKLMPKQERGRAGGLALRNLPTGWKSAAERAKRFALAREMWERDPDLTIAQVDEKVTNAFGVGLAQYALSELKATIQQEIKDKKQQKKDERQAAKAAKLEASEAAAAPVKPVPVMNAANDIAEQLEVASQLILEAIPNLVRYTLTVNDAGQVEVDYEVKRSGKLTFGKKP